MRSWKEEHQLRDISCTKIMDEVKITTEKHAHEKIDSCRHMFQEKVKQNPHLGREISLAEVVWFVLRFKYTHCTADFVKVSTLPLGNLATTKRQQSNTSVSPAIARVIVELPAWRQYTTSQIAHIKENDKSSYGIDATSAFNL